MKPLHDRVSSGSMADSSESGGMIVIGHLSPSAAQQVALQETLTAFRQACDFAIAAGRAAGTSSNQRIHHLAYRDIRRQYALGANLAVRAVALAARTLKDHRDRLAYVPPIIHYDQRIFSLSSDGRTVSLSSIRGRLRGIPLCMNAAHLRRLMKRRPVRIVLERLSGGRYEMRFVLREGDGRSVEAKD